MFKCIYELSFDQFRPIRQLPAESVIHSCAYLIPQTIGLRGSLLRKYLKILISIKFLNKNTRGLGVCFKKLISPEVVLCRIFHCATVEQPKVSFVFFIWIKIIDISYNGYSYDYLSYKLILNIYLESAQVLAANVHCYMTAERNRIK